MRTDYKDSIYVLELAAYVLIAGLTAYNTTSGPMNGHAVAGIAVACLIAFKAKISPGSESVGPKDDAPTIPTDQEVRIDVK